MTKQPAPAMLQLLQAAQAGDTDAVDRLWPAALKEVRASATGQPTLDDLNRLLSNEHVRLLVKNQPAQRESRARLLAALGQALRTILVDDARSQRRLKRRVRGVLRRLEDLVHLPENPLETILAVDAALERLKNVDPLAADVFGLRYVLGLSTDEVSAAMNISAPALDDRLRTAKTWLHRDLGVSRGAIRSRARLFDARSRYTQLRLAWGDGRQRLREYFSGSKEQGDDPDRQRLAARIRTLLPRQESALPSQSRSGRGPTEGPPQIMVLVGQDVRIGPGPDVRGQPDFAGSGRPGAPPQDRFWVRAGELPPDWNVLVSVVFPEVVASLRARHGERAVHGERLRDLDAATLLAWTFSDEWIDDLDVARIVSSAPAWMLRTDFNGRVWTEVELGKDTLRLPDGTWVVLVVE